jgi:hypothetical protein
MEDFDFSSLQGYEPKIEEKTDFEILKGKFNCLLNHMRVDGDKVEWELEIADGEKNAGRRF